MPRKSSSHSNRDEPTVQGAGRTAARRAAVVAVGLLLVGYLVLFYAAEPLHWQPLTFVLLPDVLLQQWVGGSFQRFGVLDRLPVLGLAAAILTVAWLLGRGLLRVLKCGGALTRLETLVFGCGAGLQILSLWMLVAGLAGQLHRAVIVLLPPLLLAALSALLEVRNVLQPARGAQRGGPALDDSKAPRSALARYGLWLILPPSLLILAGGVLPPWEFDVREYHLQVPKEWYRAGEIGFLPHNVYGNMPLGAEMQALLAMVAWPGEDAWWWGALVGKTVMASCAMLTGLGLYAAGRRFLSVEAGVVAAVVYLATPWTAFVSMAGLNDAVVGFYALLAVYATLLGGQTAGRNGSESGAGQATADSKVPVTNWAALAGWFAGASVACKYPALLLVVLPLGAWWCRPRLAQKGRATAVFVLLLMLACGPWFAKNWVLAGNPTYPLLVDVFGGRTRTAERDEQWRKAHAVPRDAKGRRYSAAQAASSLSQIAWRSPWLSPLLVPLATLSLLAAAKQRRWRASLLPLAGFLLFGVAAWWLATHRIERFLVPLLPIAALLAGGAALWHTGRFWRGAVAGLLVAMTLAGCLTIGSRLFPADNRFLMALTEFHPDLPHPADPGFAFTDPVHDLLNRVVPEGSRVLLVGDAQPFNLQREALYNTCFDASRLEQLLKGAGLAEERRAALREAGISHVYVKWSEIDRYRSPGNYGFPDFVTRPLIRRELVERQGVLKRVPLELDPERAELFEVR